MVCPVCTSDRVMHPFTDKKRWLCLHCGLKFRERPAFEKEYLAPITAQPAKHAKTRSHWQYGLGPGFRGDGWTRGTA